MAVLLGGRAAEQLFFGDISTGAADDLAKATDIARDMVMRYGMAERLGPVSYESQRPAFLTGGAPDMGWHERRYSDATAHAIDLAVQRILEAALTRTIALLERQRDVLERGARLLLEKETLDETELRRIKAELRPLESAAAAE